MIEKVPPDLSRYLICPMPGLLTALHVGEGDKVEAGQPLAVVEAMKMENILRAEKAGTVKKVERPARRQPRRRRGDPRVRMTDGEEAATVRIESYRDAHFGGVDALWKEAFPDDPPRNRAAAAIPEKLAVQPELLLVALDGDEVVGTAMAGYDGHRGWLYSVAVRRSHQRPRDRRPAGQGGRSEAEGARLPQAQPPGAIDQ